MEQGRLGGVRVIYVAAGLRDGERKAGGKRDEDRQGELAGHCDPGGQEEPGFPRKNKCVLRLAEDTHTCPSWAVHVLEEMLSQCRDSNSRKLRVLTKFSQQTLLL